MNTDIGKSLLAKADIIIEDWIEAIRENVDVESSKDLTYNSVRDSIPLVIEALATLLSQAITDDSEKLDSNSWEHGIVRAEQGYDVAEIVREYGLLRKIIFRVLKPDLLANSSSEILQRVELIDSVIDRIVTLSLESYVRTRLDELENVRSQLVLTNQELTRLVATQKEDVSHMAHELKSPINAIMGFSSLLLQQQKKATQGNETSLSLQMTEKVISNSRQLLRLINDILEISRYETGQIPLKIELQDTKAIFHLVVDTLEIAAIQKNLEIVLDCDRAPQTVRTDALRIQQILTNLISNAIRYTESGTVTIRCFANDNERWSIVVADTGIGMSLEEQAQIFEPYYRVSSKGSYSEESTGLGLAIVDKLVRLLKGTIMLESELGKGSTLTVTLPLEIS